VLASLWLACPLLADPQLICFFISTIVK